MSDQETVGIGTETSPARDDLGQMTDEAIMERMFVSDEPAPVEETTEAQAEEEYEEEVEETSQTLDEDDYEDDDVEEAIDESYDDDSDEEPQMFTVKVDGKELEVNLEELKRGYSGQSYINQSMQKVAEARKETEQLYATLAHERGQVQQALQLLQNGTLSTPPVAPDEALFQSDPLGYMEAKLNYDKQAAEYQEKLGYLQQQVQANNEVHQYARQAYLAKEAELLQGFAPELFDEDKGSEARERLVSSATEAYGFTVEELGALMDHRHVRVLMDAIRYQELNSESGKKRVEQKMKNKPVRSSKRRVNAEQAKRRKAQQKLKKSGDIEDAISLILE